MKIKAEEVFSVNLSSMGRYHGFDLAKQLDRLHILKNLYTSYPRSKLIDLDINDKVMSYPWFFTPIAILNRWGWKNAFQTTGYFLADSFDGWVSKHLSFSDVFHFLSGFGLKSLNKFKKKFGGIAICDRGSSHIVYQQEIIRQEFEYWGISPRNIDPRMIERELEEYDSCDAILVPSDFVLNSFLEKKIPRYKLFKAPYGVDLNLFKPYPKEDNTFRLLYTGTLSVRKGIGHLLEAVKRIGSPEIELWLIGGLTNEIQPVLEKYSGFYKYLGFIPRSQLPQFYSQCSVLIQPSIEEGLSLVMAQAMASGLPVIATTNTGASDLFQDGVEGFIIPPARPDLIVEKVNLLYQDKHLLESMRSKALTRVQSIDGWNSYGERVMKVYQDNLRITNPT